MSKRGRIYNNFYTPELWAQVNKENKRILDDFLSEYKQRKMSKGTIDGYYHDLRIIFIYILKELDNRCILELNKKNFRGLSLYFTEECGMPPARTNRLKSAVNSMLTFCEEDDDYDYEINYAKKVKGIPRTRVKDDEDDFFFTFEEFIKVRDILVEKGRLQDAVLWSIGFDSAGRKNELFQIEKHGLTEHNKTNIVVGKRGKKFPLVYLDDTKELIKKYLKERGQIILIHFGLKAAAKINSLYRIRVYSMIVSYQFPRFCPKFVERNAIFLLILCGIQDLKV